MEELCKKCILPSNYAGIRFNEKGICNYCSDKKPREYLGKQALIETFYKILSNRENKKYDCVVGLSGGRDSTYMLWYIVKKLNLNPLAVFVDSGLIPEQTLINIQTTVKSLNVDLIIKKHDYLKKSFPHHLKAWIKNPVPASLITLCVGCRLGLHKYIDEEAIKRKIPIVINGATPFEGKQYKSNIVKINPKSKSKTSFILGYIKQVFLNPALIMNITSLRTQLMEFYTAYYYQKRIIKKNKIHRISFFHEFHRWEEEKIENTLKKELNWKPYPGLGSSYRGDCKIGIIRQFLYFKTLGYNDKDDHLSCLIRDGQITREEVLNRIEKERFTPENILRKSFQKAGIDFDKFMNTFNKKYKKTDVRSLKTE